MRYHGPVPTPDPALILKRRPKRTVYRENHPERGTVIVKRFHAPTWWQRLGDRHRAQREARALQEWHALGLPVPFPATVRRQARRWELVLPELDGARTLPEWLQGTATLPLSRAALAREVGRVLAQLDRSGRLQGDPHPGNLLFDRRGHPWLIDPTPAPAFSQRAQPDRARWIRLCGQLRTISTPGFRALVLRAYAEHEGPAPLPSDPLRWEAEAREQRLRELGKRADRWLRESGATHATRAAITARGSDGASPGGRTTRTNASNSAATWKQLWWQYALCQEAEVPACAPVRVSLGPQIALESQPPAGWRRLQEPPAPAAAGRFLGRWHDRGFAPAFLIPGGEAIDSTQPYAHSALGIAGDGTLYVDPERLTIPRRWLAERAGPADPLEQPQTNPFWFPYQQDADAWKAFLEAFVEEQHAPRELRQRLRLHLTHHGTSQRAARHA